MESKWSSEEGIDVKGYDIFHPLVNFWSNLLEQPHELAEQMRTLCPTKEVYTQVKEILLSWEYTQDMLKDWKTDYYVRTPTKLDSLTAAAYYYFNHNLSYGPMYLGWISKIYQDQGKWDRMVDYISTYKNDKLDVSQASFEDVIGGNEFLYLDPPYYLEKDKDNKMFKGIYPNANIDVHHTGFNHELLRDLLHSHNGKFVLSYNDCETIREYYKGFQFEYPEWHYSYALGETRIGKNKESNEPKKSHEILIIKH